MNTKKSVYLGYPLKKIIKINTIFMITSIFLLLFTFISPASAATGGSSLKVTIIETNPYPAKIGQYVSLTLQVENIGGDKAENVDIEVVPAYPFSLDPGVNPVKNIGVLNPGNTANKEFYLFVDKSAQKGVRTIDIRTRPNKDSQWTEKTFDIRIGTQAFDSKGTVELQELISNPKVFMPGDRGTITVTLKNTATQPKISLDGKEYDTNARIQSVVLRPLSDEITVLNPPYEEMGLLGPGDSIKLTFNVKVADNAPEGIHNLELAIEGNSFDYSCKKNIPIKVDSSNVKVIPSKDLRLVNGQSTLEFDVANTHPNEFNSVSIKPEAEGIEFYPKEYFIGPMNSDELFTIEFNAVLNNSSGSNKEIPEKINMNLTSSYNNGINRHTNTVGNISLATGYGGQQSGSMALIVAVGIILVSIPAFLLYYRKKK